MNRRTFLALVPGSLLAAPFAAEAQQPAGKVSRIGYLSPLSPAADATRREGFQQGLEKLGYREGQNIAIEYRWAEGKLDRQDDLAAELVRLKIDVLLAAGGNHTVRAAKKATASIPIVMAAADDAVASGFVASLARPGGNITGLNTQTADLAAKRLELLREALPSIHRVAVLWNPAVPERAIDLKSTQVAARTLHVEIQSLEVRRPEDLDDKLHGHGQGPCRGSCHPRGSRDQHSPCQDHRVCHQEALADDVHAEAASRRWGTRVLWDELRGIVSPRCILCRSAS